MADLTPELLAQLEEDAAWLSPDENPYRLGIDGERTIDGEEEDADEMTIYGAMDDGASYEVATFHVDDMAPHAVRIFAALPALVAAAKERDQLRAQLEDDHFDSDVIDQRDAFHDCIDQIADALGDETEWTSCNDRGDRAIELALEIVKERDQLRGELEIAKRFMSDAAMQDPRIADAWVGADKERNQLRAEVERLRGLGLEAVGLLDHADVLDRGGTIYDLRAEIERKP